MRFLFVLSLLLTIGCGHTPEPQGRLRLPMQAEPASLHPHHARDIYSKTAIKMLYDGLTRIDASGSPILSLAQDVEISSDGLTYTFTLRHSCWSDGTPLTAHDFVRGWHAALSPESPSALAQFLFPIRGAAAHLEGVSTELGITALDTHTLRVELESPTTHFLELAALPPFMPLAANAELTNGPFSLESWLPGERLSLARNESYWEPVALEGIELIILQDANTAYYLFQEGELDWVGSPLSRLPAEVIAHEPVSQFSLAQTTWLKLNTHMAPCTHPKVRRALALAIDREALCTHIAASRPTPATGAVPPTMGLSSKPYFADGAVHQARQLLREAREEEGWEQVPRITISYGDSELVHQLSQAIAQRWQEALGIRVDLRRMETRVFLDRVSRSSYQVACKDWMADVHDPVNFLELFTYAESPGEAGLNETGWENETFQTLLSLASQETDSEKRHDLLRGAESILMSEMPLIPICHNAFCYLSRDDLEGNRPPSSRLSRL